MRTAIFLLTMGALSAQPRRRRLRHPLHDVRAGQRQRITAAIPRQALVKPKKARKILVMGLALNGAFYHGSTRLGNLSLSSMSEFTGAFTPVFSNDLDNLKYPKIKQYDAVFLNNLIGDVFADRDALDGLIRYVREGGGVAGLHAVSWASPNVPKFGELMGATPRPINTTASPGRCGWTIPTVAHQAVREQAIRIPRRILLLLADGAVFAREAAHIA